MSGERQITAVLGPTNTGTTHYAIERMLGYRTGVLGLPLRHARLRLLQPLRHPAVPLLARAGRLPGRAPAAQSRV